MNHIGSTFLFDYGDMVIRVEYLSERKMAWEQVKGPEAGRKGEEEYGATVIRPDILFLWWREEDSSIVTQVADFGKGHVFTTWISPDRTFSSFQGTIRPAGA